MFPPCRLAAGLLATTAFLLSSCNSPTRPETPRPETPEQPTAGTTARLQLVAPTEIAPGQSVQLVANATAVNGSVEDVSRRADWKVFWATGTSVLVLTETGVLTAGDLGYGTVEVKFEGKSAIAVIIVVSKK